MTEHDPYLTDEQVALIAASIASLRQPGNVVMLPSHEEVDPVTSRAAKYLHWLKQYG